MNKGERGIYHVSKDRSVYGRVLHSDGKNALIESFHGAAMERKTWLIKDVGYTNDPFDSEKKPKTPKIAISGLHPVAK